MGKNNQAPKKGVEAPKVKVTEEKVNEQPKNVQGDETVVDFTKDLTAEQIQSHVAGLDPNRRMDMIRVMHETFRMDPMAPSHTGFSAEAVGKINKINAAMQIGALICELQTAKNEFTMLMPKLMLDNIKEIGAEMGVSLNTKLLPAPDKNGNVSVPSKAIVVSAETKKAAKEEIKVLDEKPELNPQNIKDTEGLRKAAIYVLADTKTNVRPYNRINAAIDLYYSWLYFQAADEAAKEKLKNTSKATLFSELVEILGTCPFSMDGMSKILYNVVSQTKSPISAFCMLRKNSIDSNGRPTVDDPLIADYVRILVSWNAKSRIESDNESINTCNSNIAVLNKNKKQNAAAIKREEEKIEAYKAAIESHNEVINFVTTPDSNLADVMPEAYYDKDHEDYKVVRRVVSEIFKTYFPGIDILTVDPEWIKHSMQQYIGVVLNFFRDPLSKFKNYNEGNITEITFVKEEKKSEEEKPQEESSKEEKPKK